MIQFAKENKSLLFMIAFFLFALELEIFVSAALKSGDHSKIQVLNNRNEIIYESDENQFYQFNKYYFEHNFGPLENYRIHREPVDVPFPFRGWLISAIGIPVGFMLILGFIVKAWAVFFKGEAPIYESHQTNTGNNNSGRIEQLIEKVSKLNIFVLGFFIVAALVLYWVLPDMILFLSRLGLETLIRFKWFFIACLATITGIFIWFIYLKYLLAKKAIESRTEIAKLKLQIIHDTASEDIAHKLLSMDDNTII